MRGVYAAWAGQPVILQLSAEGIRVPLRGVIVGESDDAVGVSIGDGLDVEIQKNMVLAVEEVSQTEPAMEMMCSLPSRIYTGNGHIVAPGSNRQAGRAPNTL